MSRKGEIIRHFMEIFTAYVSELMKLNSLSEVSGESSHEEHVVLLLKDSKLKNP